MKRFNNDRIQGDMKNRFDLYRQNIMNFISTPKGSQPSRPDFGTDALKNMQLGINRAEPLIRKEVYQGLIKFFPELGRPTKITVNIDPNNPTTLQIYVVYEKRETNLEVLTNVRVN